jgi:hypothetical protein
VRAEAGAPRSRVVDLDVHSADILLRVNEDGPPHESHRRRSGLIEDAARGSRASR